MRAHGPDDRRHLVDRVRDDVACRVAAASDEIVAFAEQPVGLADGARGADEEVLDDQIEAAPVAPQELEGVPGDDLEAQAAEAEVPPAEAQHLPVQLDADDLGVRIQRADRPAHAAGGEAEQQHAPAAAPRQEQDRGGQRPPDDTGERAARAVDRGLRAVDPKLEALARASNENSICPTELASRTGSKSGPGFAPSSG